jgi:DNA-3-methyladenine glycosylase II
VNSKKKSHSVVSAVRPSYWEDAGIYLAQRDRVLSRLISEYGSSYLQSHGDAFVTLARSIVGQQISVKAAQTVWEALGRMVKPMNPAKLLATSGQDLCKAGLSGRKAEYLTDLALHFDHGLLSHEAWPTMSDSAIIAELMAIRGVGRWTAEMFLIFHLMRPNVLPLDDVGLIRGISQNYFSGEAVSRSDAREVAQVWEPYCTVATWYIWRSLDPVPVAY